jgi:hypothetical protein
MSLFDFPACSILSAVDGSLNGLAYLDAGSGSMILQVVLVGLAGVGVLIKYAGARMLDIVFPSRLARQNLTEAAQSQPVAADSVAAPVNGDQ